MDKAVLNFHYDEHLGCYFVSKRDAESFYFSMHGAEQPEDSGRGGGRARAMRALRGLSTGHPSPSTPRYYEDIHSFITNRGRSCFKCKHFVGCIDGTWLRCKDLDGFEDGREFPRDAE